ncbi:hypothetical protein ACI8AC_07385 [Geodermatophilus sp. SYSU D00758]
MDASRSTPEDRDGSTSPGEYLVGALGGLLVLALVGFLTYQALGVRETGPELAVVVTRLDRSAAGWTVYYETVNTGGRTAEAVQIGGTLVRDGRPVEQASSSIAYLPPHSSRVGALVFSTDPGSGELRVGTRGYRVP